MSTYTVQKGDNLSKIASKYGTTWQNLYNTNKSVVGSNPNLIYAGQVLTIPGTTNTTAKATTTTKTATATPAKTTQQLAAEYAKAQTSNVANENKALLDQYEKIAESRKAALANQRELTNNQINAQRDDVMDVYHTNARQAYINSMLGKKTVEQQLSQAGLHTSGLLGSAYANVENAYGNNLAALQTSRDKSINDINRQLNDAQIEYARQENELLADIENAKLELQKYGNELAYKKYQDAINNYMTFANYDYTKAKDERDYNYKVERDKVSDSHWQQEFDLAKKKASSSGSSSRSSSGSKNVSSFSDTTGGLSSRGKELYNEYITALEKSSKDPSKANLYESLNSKTVAANFINKYYQKGQLTSNDVKILTSMLN